MLIAISYTVLLVVPAVGEQARFARCSMHLVTAAFSSCTSNYVVSLSMQLHYSTKKKTSGASAMRSVLNPLLESTQTIQIRVLEHDVQPVTH